MKTTTKKVKSGVSARPAARTVRKTVRGAVKKPSSALAIVAERLPAAPGVAKHAHATLHSVPGRTKRFLKSNPVRVLLGAAAVGFVVAKIRHLV
jgi:hypothetical protein